MEELFPDGRHVRLRSRWHNQYVYADEGEDAVELNNHGTSLNAVWRVRRYTHEGTSYVLFHGDAYRRYLSMEQVPNVRVVQRDLAHDVLWEAIQAEDGSGDVLLIHHEHGPWLNPDAPGHPSMWWIVEAVKADERFEDGTHVRLWCRWNNAYLWAAEDGSSITGSTDGASLNAVWTAHRLERHGNVYVLFHGAAYGRYLSVDVAPEQNDDPAAEQNDDPEQNDAAAEQNDDPEQNDAAAEQNDDPEKNDDPAAEQNEDPEQNDAAAEQNDDPEQNDAAAEQNDDPEQNDAAAEQNNPVFVVRFVQRAYGDPEQNDVLWLALDEQEGTDDFLLLHRVYGVVRNPDGTKMRWMIEDVPPRENPPDLPPLIPLQLQQPPMVGGRNRNRRVALAPPEFQRTIRYVRANHQGDINAVPWGMLEFNGRSVFHLRSDLARELGEANALDITLCVRAGSQGRLTPLVIDLPADNQEMEIVVFSTGSLAAEELVYPDVDADEGIED